MTERTVKQIMKELYATGLSPEQQALVGELILSASRYSVHHHYGEEVTPGAVRMRRHRERHKASQSVTCDGDGVLLENKNSTNKTEKENNTPLESPRDALKTLLDSEHAQALIEHRQRLRKPLTWRAAKALVKELAKAPDPNAAVETMMARGWAGFNIEWMKSGKNQPNVLAYKPRPAPRPYREIKAELEAKKP